MDYYTSRQCSRIRILLFFQNPKKTRFLRFLKTTCQKPRTRYQSFRMVTLLTFRNTEHTNTKSEHFPECRPKKIINKVSMKSIAYTVRSETTNNYVYIQHYIQELSYRKQIARQLRTQYVEGIYRPKYNTVTLKCRLRVTRGHKRNHWIDCTRLTISRVI